ncbi:putative sulfate exporter family transporter [Devosia sp. MSA67]|uniref:Sulfate exporter family transporter n=2 Tax=Devosia sediminis TaxID=2798801 RepID=A0A934ISC4_9HYPH|nr:putative sulfate exporter family transporter [Devosia sediminis]
MGVAALAAGVEWAEVTLSGHRWIDGLVLAILFGTGIHTAFGLDPRFRAGVNFAAKIVLELAVVALGATISGAAILGSGAPLLAAIVVVVVVALGASYAIGRLVGLNRRQAVLVACGNSICGNSAIMAAAPVIEAKAEDVAASIGFTAVLGILVVLLLPGTLLLLDLSAGQYGIVAGLSVYAVPQVLAATAQTGPVSSQIATVVKLVRVLMLGPVVLVLGLITGRRQRRRVAPGLLVPWFIIGFLVLMLLRSAGALPQGAIDLLGVVSGHLTLVAMAALGLSVDLRSIVAAGGKVLLAGSLSIAMLVTLALIAVAVLPPI